VFGQAFVLAGVTGGGSLAVCRLAAEPGRRRRAQQLHAAVTAAVRFGLVAGLAISLVGTAWNDVVRRRWGLGRVVLLDELVLLLPFVAAVVLCWAAGYPADRALRSAGPSRPWGLRRYLAFNFRHHLLVIGVPMTLILLAKDVIDRYRSGLIELIGAGWAAEASLVVVAGVVFLIAPIMVRRIWPTRPLAAGTLRDRLEQLCRRIGLRYRQILLWQTDRAVANAAVMGLVGPVRYVLLSDCLVESLAERQVEAVFGHEAGHVKYHHILFYLVFAACSTLAVGAVLELLIRLGGLMLPDRELWALLMLGAIWLAGFGWISRRFERQADLFGVQCVTAGLSEEAERLGQPAPVLAAELYAVTLERIAVLNGIGPTSRSWRHSSVASRMAFVRRCAAEPEVAAVFQRRLMMIKAVLLVGTAIGSVMGAWLYWPPAWRLW
ncbi:MAG: M48 family metallopeptidase, partial [Phycisphaerae bacterium]